MTLPRQSAALLGASAVALELPMYLTLFVVRDSVPIVTAFALVGLASYLGIAGLVVGLRAHSGVGVALSAFSLVGYTFVYLVFWLLAQAFAQG